MSAKKLYVIGNSHMDPIWLWRLREGRSTWLNTCRSVVRMMRKYPFLKFCRSSSACYEWIESCDPALFGEIRQLVPGHRAPPAHLLLKLRQIIHRGHTPFTAGRGVHSGPVYHDYMIL